LGDDKPKLKGWQEAADRLGVSVGWLKSQTKHGQGPTYLQPSPKTILFRDDDLDAWKAAWKVVRR
jgi:hypothetical protein